MILSLAEQDVALGYRGSSQIAALFIQQRRPQGRHTSIFDELAELNDIVDDVRTIRRQSGM